MNDMSSSKIYYLGDTREYTIPKKFIGTRTIKVMWMGYKENDAFFEFFTGKYLGTPSQYKNSYIFLKNLGRECFWRRIHP